VGSCGFVDVVRSEGVEMALRKVSAVNVLFDLGYLKNYRKF
jgi:hypothetical protein